MISRDELAEAVGTKFTLSLEGAQSIDIELVDVSQWRERRSARSFAALFLAPEGCTIQQGMYDLEHQTLGALQLFLVPVGMDGTRLQLEALFNLVREKEQSNE